VCVRKCVRTASTTTTTTGTTTTADCIKLHTAKFHGFFSQYRYRENIKEDEMGEECGTHRVD
jgi:hypothetical protein